MNRTAVVVLGLVGAAIAYRAEAQCHPKPCAAVLETKTEHFPAAGGGMGAADNYDIEVNGTLYNGENRTDWSHLCNNYVSSYLPLETHVRGRHAILGHNTQFCVVRMGGADKLIVLHGNVKLSTVNARGDLRELGGRPLLVPGLRVLTRLH